MIIKIFTMVKDEVDIVEDWIKYHGNIFGYKNLYIIDNNSVDGTYDILQKYIESGITIFQKDDYRLKGEYMTEMINDPKYGEYDIAFPVDIDEFITHYDKTNNTISPEHTYKYIKTLSETEPVFKANYVQMVIDSRDEGGYTRATIEAKHGLYDDRGRGAKTFFNKKLWSGVIDHGNHYHTDNYYMTDIVLVHYHQRNTEQMKIKVINNLKGFGYDHTDITGIKRLLHENDKTEGGHHMQNIINITEGTHNMYTTLIESECVDLTPIIVYIQELH